MPWDLLHSPSRRLRPRRRSQPVTGRSVRDCRECHLQGNGRATAMGVRSLTGRREVLDTARAELTARPGVLFHGPAGIGKSVLVAALLASLAAHDRPVGTVLHCSPAEEDARLPFVGLIDLFAQV